MDMGGGNFLGASGVGAPSIAMPVRPHVGLHAQRRILTAWKVNRYSAVACYLVAGVMSAIWVIQPNVIERFFSSQGFRHTIDWSYWLPRVVTTLVTAGILLLIHLLVIWALAQSTIRCYASADAEVGLGGNPKGNGASPSVLQVVMRIVTCLFVMCDLLALVYVFSLLFDTKTEILYQWWSNGFQVRMTDISQYVAEVLLIVVTLVFPNCLMLFVSSLRGCHQPLRHNMGKAMLLTSVVVFVSVLVAIALMAAVVKI